jgi:hypothetical protein
MGKYEIQLNQVVMEQDEYDYRNRETVMLIKILMTDEMFLEDA